MSGRYASYWNAFLFMEAITTDSQLGNSANTCNKPIEMS